jgi:hypothetical protein
MSNQMIALQSRGAKMPDPTAQTAKFVNMMNMAKQQEAAQRQASLAQQSMDINLAEEGRRKELHGPALKKAQLEFVGLVADKFREDVAKVRDGDTAGAEAARAEAVANVPGWANMIPPVSQWTPEVKAQLMSKASEIVAQTNPPAKSSIEYAAAGGKDDQGRPVPVGTAIQVITGRNPSTRVIPVAGASAGTPTAAQPSPNPVPVGEFGETRVAPDGGQLDEFQQDHLRRMKEGLGMTNTPASFTGMGGAGAAQITPEVMSRIADSAFQTGVIAQVDFDQLLATQPPENRQAFTDAFRRANITLQADAPSLADSGMGQQQMAANPVQTPQARFADLRGPAPQSQTAGLRGAPPMEQTMAQYQPLQRRDPNMAPYPGSAQVPLSRVEAEGRAGRIKPAETAANAQATQNVELEMKPKIAAATKTAERVAELKLTAPKARNATLSLIAEIDDRINTIDELLRSPNRHLINGPIEGNLPRLLQTGARADAQAAFDKIKNTATLTSLIDMRKSTETGASPVGANPTDRDARIVEQAASKLIQTGELPKMDAELIAMRQKLYRTRVSAVDGYAAEYGDVIASDPRLRLNAPAIADRYIRTTGSGKKGTSTKVDLNNPLLKSLLGVKR